MKKHIIYFFLFFVVFTYGQKKEFQNQGEQENYWAEQLFEQKYVKQSFEKFKGKISIVDRTNIEFDNKTLEFWNIRPKLIEIFAEGIFYPQIVIGSEENNSVKSESELKSMSANEIWFYNLRRNDKLRISGFEELLFLSKTPTIKRFRFWKYTFDSMNPQVYFIELTNEKATEKTELSSFIKGAKLTFVKEGWIII